MKPVFCVIGGCNGAGKTTLAKELLPLMSIRRFLNADEIARGLSPLDPSLSAFRAGRLLIQETNTLLKAGSSFALESTLSGKIHVPLIKGARERGYHVILHYIVIESATQAVERVALRVKHGGHHVTETDVRRRFERSRRNFSVDYLPLADEWVVWDNSGPPHIRIADNTSCRAEDVQHLIAAPNIHEAPNSPQPEIVRLGLEANRIATAKMLDYYRCLRIRVTPKMTLQSS